MPSRKPKIPHVRPAEIKPRAGDCNPAPMLVNIINPTIKMFAATDRFIVDKVNFLSLDATLVAMSLVFVISGFIALTP